MARWYGAGLLEADLLAIHAWNHIEVSCEEMEGADWRLVSVETYTSLNGDSHARIGYRANGLELSIPVDEANPLYAQARAACFHEFGVYPRHFDFRTGKYSRPTA